MVLLFIGASGSGKDTQAEFLSEKFGYKVISTGQLMREEVARDTELGKQLAEMMQKGWVPDDITYKLLSDHLMANPADGYVLTGVVRTAPQIELLDAALENIGKSLDKVVFFEIPEEEAVKRLSQRTDANGNVRSDDNEDSIRLRLKANRETIDPILAGYEAQGKLARIDGTGSIEDVRARVEAVLN